MVPAMATYYKTLLQGSILMFWGLMSIGFILSSRVSSYLHPGFVPWLAVSGIVLVILALVVLTSPSQGNSDCCGHDHAHDHEHDAHTHDAHTHEGHTHEGHTHEGHTHEGHTHDERTHDHDPSSPWHLSLVAAVLVLPVAGAVLVSPSEFDASLVINRGVVGNFQDLPGYRPDRLPGEEAEEFDAGDYLRRDEQGRILATPLDLLYAAYEPDMRRDFDGKDVVLTGQYFPARKNNPDGDRFTLLRMFIMCCAADARPVGVPVVGLPEEPLGDMEWVNVSGKVAFTVENGETVPIVKAEGILPTDPPRESFLY